MNCPVCCKQLKLAIAHRKQHIAYCDDDSGAWRYVGADCWKNIKRMGVAGYRQTDVGPRWFATEQDALSCIALRAEQQA